MRGAWARDVVSSEASQVMASGTCGVVAQYLQELKSLLSEVKAATAICG